LTARGSTSALYIYDPLTDSWREGAPVPIPGGVDHCNVAAAGGKLYVLGAIRVGTAFVEGGTYEYDPRANTWQRVAQMNTPRGASGVAAIGDRIYVAGGLTTGGSVAVFESFDTQTRQWSVLPPMPTARDHLTAQAAGEKFYAISGRAAQIFTVNEEYDVATRTWRSRARIPTGRGGLGSAVVDGRILVFGGEGPSGTPENTFRQNEEYDPATDSWRSLPPMPTPRHGLYGVAVDGRAFAPSGGPRAGAFFSNVHEVYHPPLASAPAIREGGAVNAASYAASAAPGSLVTLLGTGFSRGSQVGRAPLGTSLNSVRVSVNGVPPPLLFVSPEQANFLLPFGTATGDARIRISYAGVESADAVLAVERFAPGIFSLTQTGEGQGAILIAGTGLIARATRDAFSRAAVRGDVVEIYCTGLGEVTGDSQGLQHSVIRPFVTIGGAAAEVLYSGLAPGLPGVYQINARVPAGAATGIAVPVRIGLGAADLRSNTVTMAVVE
jgi:uncharacterized protein (TIGR03437 family)